MKTLIVLLGSLVALAAVAQESKRQVWVWTDADGVTQYSDRPMPGATPVELSTSTPVTPPRPVAAPTAPAPKPVAQAVEYQSLEIWQPENGASFFGADAIVDVRMRTDPALADTDTLRLYLDGKLVEGAPDALEYSLANLERGAHSVTAVIADAQGKEKIRSEPRVFHIRQPSVNPPQAVGPNLKPKQPRSN